MLWARELNCSIKEIEETDLELLFDLIITKLKLNSEPECHYLDEFFK